MAYKAWKNSEIERALREAKGMVYLAARQLGCHPDTIKARLKTSPQLRAVLESEDELVTDTAELKLYQAIITGEPWAIQYRLSRKGKARGYGEQPRGTPEAPLVFTLQLGENA